MNHHVTNPRISTLATLLLAVVVATAQTNLFNVSTTAPAAKSSREPQNIEVRSKTLKFSQAKEFALYTGDVQANTPQFFLSCESLRLNFDFKAARQTNQPPAGAGAAAVPPLSVPAGGLVPANGIVRSAEAMGGIVFSNKADASQAFAAQAVYQATNDAFVLTGNARILKAGLTTTADQIIFHRSKGDFEAVGNQRTEFVPTSTNSALPKP